MMFSFENFYAFKFTLSLFGMLIGIYLVNSNIIFILLILVSLFFCIESIIRWNKSQKNKEALEKLKLERENATLDFDIKKVRAERDIDWYPDDIINGEPVGFNEICTNKYKIELIVYNNSIVDNVIRNIDVCVLNKKKKANTNNIVSVDDVNRVPVSIDSRDYKNLVFYAGVDEMIGNKGDKLKIILTSMDNKKTVKIWEVEYYYDGQNLANRYS